MSLTDQQPAHEIAEVRDLGSVVAIHIAARSGESMEPRDTVTAVAGVGIVGDRYHGSRHRHVSVQSLEELAEASTALGRQIDPALTRRTVTVAKGRVPTTPGSIIELGDVRLEVVRIAAPCARMDDEIGAGARPALRRRGGAICRVVDGGQIAVGAASAGVIALS